MEWSLDRWRMGALVLVCVAGLIVLARGARSRLDRADYEYLGPVFESSDAIEFVGLTLSVSEDVEGAVVVAGEARRHGATRFMLARSLAIVSDADGAPLGWGRVFLEDFHPGQTRPFRILVECDAAHADGVAVSFEEGYGRRTGEQAVTGE